MKALPQPPSQSTCTLYSNGAFSETFHALKKDFLTFFLKKPTIKEGRTHVNPIIFFDGVCGLCDGFVNFLIHQDRLALLKFAPLQGKTASFKILSRYQIEMNTIVYCDSNGIYEKSDAIIQIFSGPLSKNNILWKLTLLFKLIPRFFRNIIYDWVSKNRYQWFGKLKACQIPDPQLKSRFLD